MNKVISFDDNIEKDNKYKIRLLVYNIIEYISQKENIYINNLYIDPDSINCYCYCNITKKRIVNNIEVGTHKDIVTSLAKSYNIPKFIKSYNISEEYNYLTHLTFQTLHELGHAVHNVYIYDRLKYKNFNKYNALVDNIRSAIFLAFPIRPKYKLQDNEFNYCYDPAEQIANQYAYLNFKEVWDMLVYRGFIEEGY